LLKYKDAEIKSKMRLLSFLLLVLISFASAAFAYPPGQLKECILRTKQSPIILGVPELSIERYCDCALKLIVDDQKDAMNSVNLCATTHFG